MREAILITALIIILLSVGQFEISFHPFRLSMEGWRDLVATLFMVLALFLFGSARYTDGYEKGFKEGIEEFIKRLEEKVNEHNEIIKTKEEQHGKEDWRSI